MIGYEQKLLSSIRVLPKARKQHLLLFFFATRKGKKNGTTTQTKA
jgi:hypothetical protein